MTTLTPRSPAPAPAGGSPAKGGPGDGDGTRGRTGAPRRVDDPSVAATLALALVTLSVALGFGRLFNAGPFFWPVTLATLAAHGVAWWCRRNEILTGLAAMATLGAASLIVSWTVLGHTTAYGIPLPYTLRVAAEAMADARSAFAVVRAPTAVMPGFLVAVILAIGVAAFMADWAAFRLHTAIEALVPAFTLFVFTSALADDRHRTTAVVAFVATALAFLAVFGMTTRTKLAWFGGRPGNGPTHLATAGVLLGAAALVAGLVVGPALPGAGSEPILKYKNRNNGGSPSRTTISPLVDIRGRLVERADIEVFRVRAEQRSYWRLTSLDTFDGSIWSANASYRPNDGDLGTEERLTAGIETVASSQAFTISGLDSIWLPAAFRPLSIDGVDGVSYNAETGSLITDDETTDGYTYRVTSALPRYTAAQLERAPARAPSRLAERYLALPEISPRVAALAERIVAGKATPYQRARALQDFFHKGDFTYSLSERNGHDDAALENFLLRTKKGYCEQYAGAYAVMARSVGLPTRVAIGFTPGEQDSTGAYVVRDEHAHAWPEGYLEGFGFVAFEPTVGRGAPGAEGYTARPELQDESGSSTAATTPTTAPTTIPSDQVPTSVAPDVPDLGGGAVGEEGTGDQPLWVLVSVALLVLAIAWGIGVPLAVYLRARERRRIMRGERASVDEAARVLAAWAEAAEVLDRAGVRRRASETLLEFSSRAPASAGLGQDAAVALRTLSRDAASASFAPDGGGLGEDAAHRACEAAESVRIAVLDQLTVWQRLGWWLDPRPLLRSRRRR